MSILTPIFGFIKSQTGDNIGKTIGEDLPANWDKAEQLINDLGADKANKIQPAWITATLLNEWTGTLQYRKNQIGQLEVNGSITAGTVANGTRIATLPTGYRPIITNPVPVSRDSNGSTVLGIIIEASGNIRVYGNNFEEADTYRFNNVLAT